MKTVASYNSVYYTPARLMKGVDQTHLYYRSSVQFIDRETAEDEVKSRNCKGPDGWFVVRVECSEVVQELKSYV